MNRLKTTEQKIKLNKPNAILFILLLAAAVLLTSCSDLVRITYENGVYTDQANDIEYINAPVSYEPTGSGTEYARFNKTVLYSIPGAEPSQWLAEKYEGIGSVFYASDLVLPGPAEFKTTKILIFMPGYDNMPLASIDDPEIIASLIDKITNGSAAEAENTDDSYSLKLISSAYPFIRYNLIYIKSSDGERYLYDRGTKRTVSVGGLLDTFFTGDPGSAGAPTETTE